MWNSGTTYETETEILAKIIRCVSKAAETGCADMHLFIRNQSFDLQNRFLLDTACHTIQGSRVFLLMDYWHGARGCNTKMLYSSDHNISSVIDKKYWIQVVNPCWKWAQILHSTTRIVEYHGVDNHKTIDRERNIIEEMSKNWKSILGAIKSMKNLAGNDHGQGWCKYPEYGQDLAKAFEQDLDLYQKTTSNNESVIIGFVACEITRKNHGTHDYKHKSIACKKWNRLLYKFQEEHLKMKPGNHHRHRDHHHQSEHVEELQALVQRTLHPFPKEYVEHDYGPSWKTMFMCGDAGEKIVDGWASHAFDEIADAMSLGRDSLSLSFIPHDTEKLGQGRMYYQYIISKSAAPLCKISIEVVPHSSLCEIELRVERDALTIQPSAAIMACSRCNLPLGAGVNWGSGHWHPVNHNKGKRTEYVRNDVRWNSSVLWTELNAEISKGKCLVIDKSDPCYQWAWSDYNHMKKMFEHTGLKLIAEVFNEDDEGIIKGQSVFILDCRDSAYHRGRYKYREIVVFHEGKGRYVEGKVSKICVCYLRDEFWEMYVYAPLNRRTDYVDWD
jgi:hypothetical protein